MTADSGLDFAAEFFLPAHQDAEFDAELQEAYDRLQAQHDALHDKLETYVWENANSLNRIRQSTRRLERETDRRLKLEEELRLSSKLESVGQLAAGIAHEINTPLQYIGDNVRFLQLTVDRLLTVAEAAVAATGDAATPDDVARFRAQAEACRLPLLAERAPGAVDDALTGVETVTRIVGAMKRFSHPGSDDFAAVDVNEALTTTMTVCRNEWKYAATIETDLDEDLPLIAGRLGPLNQVWLNLIVNATHAIVDRHGTDLGLITIATRPVDDGEAVRVEIGDNGSGIEPEHLHRIFDQFFTTKEVGRGTGQGLAIAHQVVVGEHNGWISVDSTVGEGTMFTVVLPVNQAPPVLG